MVTRDQATYTHQQFEGYKVAQDIFGRHNGTDLPGYSNIFFSALLDCTQKSTIFVSCYKIYMRSTFCTKGNQVLSLIIIHCQGPVHPRGHPHLQITSETEPDLVPSSSFASIYMQPPLRE